MKNLEAMAERLNVAVEHLWSALIQQAPITATFDLVLFVGLVALGVIVLIKFIGIYKSFEDENDKVRLVIFISAICLIALMISIALLKSIITAFLNPEYWALMQVLK
jgi:hypothetical protein